MATVKKAILRCHCNGCGRGTDHDLVAERTVQDQDAENGFWWTDHYETLQCRGCRAVCLRHTYDDASGDEDVAYYPPAISRRPPVWRWDLPTDMREMLDEIYRALHNDSSRLALMGSRTLLDMLMLAQVGDVGSFRQKLTALEKQGFIASNNAEVLSAALDAGNAAAHRGFKPASDDLRAVIDIVENLLQSVYHLKKVAAGLKKRTPTRQQRP
jgi:Domain of unknown function (DUF4145)